MGARTNDGDYIFNNTLAQNYFVINAHLNLRPTFHWVHYYTVAKISRFDNERGYQTYTIST